MLNKAYENLKSLNEPEILILNKALGNHKLSFRGPFINPQIIFNKAVKNLKFSHIDSQNFNPQRTLNKVVNDLE